MALQISQIFIIILVTCMCHSIMARSNYIRIIPGPELPFLLGDVDNSDENYPETGKLSQIDRNFQARWPWLKDLYAAGADYEDNPIKNLIREQPYESRQQDAIPTPPPPKFQGSSMRKSSSKAHAQKKSNSWSEYMTPCHFKICNFGRKRNVVLI